MFSKNGASAYIILPVGLILLYLFDPSSPNSFFPPCLFQKFTHYYCPGCGSLRAIHNLLNGNIAAAFRMNPFLVLMLPVLSVNQMIALLNARGVVKYNPPLESAHSICLILAVTIVFTILRNIPHYPFTVLAPHY